MKDRLLLTAYIIAMVLISFTHTSKLLLVILCLLLLLLFTLPMRHHERLKILKRTLISVFIFSSIVSLSYTVAGFIMGENRIDYAIMVNLRALNLTLLTLISLKYINLYKALDFSRNAGLILVLTSTHTVSYARVLHDFREAFKSRNPNKKIKVKAIENYIRRVISYFFEKSRQTSEDIYMAMKSRGFHHD